MTYYFTISLLALLPFTSFAQNQSCEFDEDGAFCKRDKVKILRQPAHRIFNSETFVNSHEDELNLSIYLDVGSDKWNFSDLKYAYAQVDGTTYRLKAERVRTSLENELYLERIQISLFTDEYIRDVADATSFTISVGGARFNFDPVLNDIRSILEHHNE